MIRPEVDDRVVLDEGQELAGDVALVGFGRVYVAWDAGVAGPGSVSFVDLEPHPVHDGLWYVVTADEVAVR